MDSSVAFRTLRADLELEPRLLRTVFRSQWQSLLRTSPWGWPSAEHSALFSLAQEVSGLEKPPKPLPGQTLLLTVSDQEERASLWVTPYVEGVSVQGHTPLVGEARQAWHDAAGAVSRAIPLLWQPFMVLARHPPSVIFLNGVALRPVLMPREASLDGASTGLSLALSLTSRLFGVPLPADLAASATLSLDGRTGAVAGLEGKLTALLTLAPSIRRLLVARGQASVCQRLLEGLLRGRAQAQRIKAERVTERVTELQVVEVGSLGEALERIWGDQLHEMFMRAGASTREREELVKGLFTLALSDKGVSPQWEPIRAAAVLAKREWPLSEGQLEQLDFVEGVALRHCGQRGQVPLPGQWLERLPQPHRLTCLAHVLQQAADVGLPPTEQAVQLAKAHLVRGLDAFEPHLKLLGALGRLHAVTGDPAQALVFQMEAARQWLERHCVTEVSYPLSEWYRLAGALEDEAAFGEAESLLARLEVLSGQPGLGSVYLRLSRAVARFRLSLQADDAAATLKEILFDRHMDVDVRATAGRWWGVSVQSREVRGLDKVFRGGVQVGEVSRRTRGYEGVLQRLEEALGEGSRPLRRCLALLELEASAAPVVQAAALERLVVLEPQPTGLLMEAAHRLHGLGAEVELVAAYVRRFYPY
ncbi:MAG: hypothetical protein ACKO6N_10390 [Myxococcota bacterium]